MENILNKDKEEIIIASIIHLSCIMPFFGLFLPLIIWIFNRDKSAFLSFHALQGLVYQSIGILLFVVGMILYTLSFFLVFILMFGTAIISGNEEPSPIIFVFFFVPFLIFFLIFFFFFLYIIYAIIGCIVTLIKKDFKYILIGKLLENYLIDKNNNTKTMNES